MAARFGGLINVVSLRQFMRGAPPSASNSRGTEDCCETTLGPSGREIGCIDIDPIERREVTHEGDRKGQETSSPRESIAGVEVPEKNSLQFGSLSAYSIWI